MNSGDHNYSKSHSKGINFSYFCLFYRSAWYELKEIYFNDFTVILYADGM